MCAVREEGVATVFTTLSSHRRPDRLSRRVGVKSDNMMWTPCVLVSQPRAFPLQHTGAGCHMLGHVCPGCIVTYHPCQSSSLSSQLCFLHGSSLAAVVKDKPSRRPEKVFDVIVHGLVRGEGGSTNEHWVDNSSKKIGMEMKSLMKGK